MENLLDGAAFSRQLDAFHAVRQHGSYEEAANALNLKAGGVRKRVRELEKRLVDGVALFEPAGKRGRLALSAHGRHFETYANSISNVWNRARSDLSLRIERARRLSIGIQFSLGERILGEFLKRAVPIFPDLSFRFTAGKTSVLMNDLIENGIDIGLVYEPAIDHTLSSEPILDEYLVMVSNKKLESWKDIEMEEYIYIHHGKRFREIHTNSYRPSFRNGVKEKDLTNCRLYFDRGALALNYAQSMDKYALYVPYRMISDRLEKDLYLVPSTKAILREVFVVCKRNGNANSIIEREIVENCISMFRDIGGLIERDEARMFPLLSKYKIKKITQ